MSAPVGAGFLPLNYSASPTAGNDPKSNTSVSSLSEIAQDERTARMVLLGTVGALDSVLVHESDRCDGNRHHDAEDGPRHT